jgi:uracil-DNA glycosylase family 4
MDQVSDKFLNQYLKQTRELYGDDLYLESHDLNSSKKKDVLLNSKLTTYGAYGDTDASLFLVNIELDKVIDEVIGPLIGEAKILLDNILSAIDRSLENDVYICNLLNNQSKIDNPRSNKLTNDNIYFNHHINLIKPKLIVALGQLAGMRLLNVDNSLKNLRGKIHDYNGIPLIVTFHPTDLLISASYKPEAWKDFKWIKSIID